MTEHYDPHPGADCCECVPRLRAQNQESAAAAQHRSAKMESELMGLRWLMSQAGRAARLSGDAKGQAIHSLSYYAKATLAEALRIADEAEQKATVWMEEAMRERRARMALEDQLAKIREAEALRKAKA